MLKRALACTVLLLVAGCQGAGGSGDPAPDASPPPGAADAAGLPPDAPAVTRPPGVMTCYSTAADTDPAAVMFRAAFTAGDRDLRAAAIDALETAVAGHPDEEELQLDLGLARLWRLAEPLPGDDSVTTQLADSLGARDHLKAALQVCPGDARIYAWLGPLLVKYGTVVNDQAAIDEGLADLDEGIAAYPSFVLFAKLLVYADAPRTSPDFQRALAAVLANIDACNQTPSDPACTNQTVPHNREGAALFLGDIYTKNLQHDDAEAVFTQAMAGADYPSWPYQAVLTGRLQDLDARVAAFGDGDTSNDPPSAWDANDQCALCHTH